MPVPSRIFGWHRQPQDDGRDFKFHLMFPRQAILPKVAYAHTAPVMDQGQEGSCVFHGSVAAMESVLIALGDPLPDFNAVTQRYLSSQFGYYEYRQSYGSVSSDDGAEIRVALKMLAKAGICKEVLWPYQAMANFATKPTAACYTDAPKHIITQYIALTGNADTLLTSIMQCIASGWGIVFGVNCTKAWDQDSGIIPTYVPGEGFDGGHCVYLWGYDQDKKIMYGQNSWGTDWGLEAPTTKTRGFFTMTFADISNPTVTSDFWTVRMTTDVPVTPPVPPVPTPPPAPIITIPDVRVGVRNNKIQLI